MQTVIKWKLSFRITKEMLPACRNIYSNKIPIDNSCCLTALLTHIQSHAKWRFCCQKPIVNCHIFFLLASNKVCELNCIDFISVVCVNWFGIIEFVTFWIIYMSYDTSKDPCKRLACRIQSCLKGRLPILILICYIIQR